MMNDETLWHKCRPPFWSIFWKAPGPDGRFRINDTGQLWRRRVDGKWQYRQDDPTWEDTAGQIW